MLIKTRKDDIMTERIKKRKKKKNKLVIALIIILILLLGVVFFVINQLDKISTHDIKKEDITINDIKNDDIKGYTNIAIFGVDSRANELTKNTRSDSIIIASINNKTKDVKLVSLYRDTYVNIEGHGYSKLNSAYAKGGPELAISTINRNFDLDVTDFVTVNFSAVTNIVDALGGVEIDIKQDEIKEVNRYTKDVAKINGTKAKQIKKPGKQTLDGTQATAYSRVRYTSGNDFRRTERQRTVIYAAMNKAKSSGIPALYALTQEILPQVYTSLKTTDILSLAKDAFSYDIVDDTGFPFEKKGKTVNKASVVLPIDLSKNVTELHKYLFETKDYTPTNTVQGISKEIAKY